MVRMTVDVTS